MPEQAPVPTVAAIIRTLLVVAALVAFDCFHLKRSTAPMPSRSVRVAREGILSVGTALVRLLLASERPLVVAAVLVRPRLEMADRVVAAADGVGLTMPLAQEPLGKARTVEQADKTGPSSVGVVVAVVLAAQEDPVSLPEAASALALLIKHGRPLPRRELVAHTRAVAVVPPAPLMGRPTYQVAAVAVALAAVVSAPHLVRLGAALRIPARAAAVVAMIGPAETAGPVS